MGFPEDAALGFEADFSDASKKAVHVPNPNAGIPDNCDTVIFFCLGIVKRENLEQMGIGQLKSSPAVVHGNAVPEGWESPGFVMPVSTIAGELDSCKSLLHESIDKAWEGLNAKEA